MKSLDEPRNAGARTGSDETRSSGSGLGQMILIVDDDVAICELVTNVLRAEGYATHSASNGVEGLEQFYLTLADLIVLDLKMPEMDGWETLIRLREVSDCPIIMLTAFGAAEDIVRALELGADDYMVKPFGIKELVARVGVLLRRATPV